MNLGGSTKGFEYACFNLGSIQVCLKYMSTVYSWYLKWKREREKETEWGKMGKKGNERAKERVSRRQTWKKEKDIWGWLREEWREKEKLELWISPSLRMGRKKQALNELSNNYDFVYIVFCIIFIASFVCVCVCVFLSSCFVAFGLAFSASRVGCNFFSHS